MNHPASPFAVVHSLPSFPRPARSLLLACILGAACSSSPRAWAQSATTTALSITSGGSPVVTVKEGTEVTLTAKVASASGTAVVPGQVNFCEVKAAPLGCTDIRLVGTVQLSSAGVATYNFYPGPGTHNFQAVFLGTHSAATSSSATTQLVVTPFYPTTTTIFATGNPGDYTLTATVTGTEGTVPPTGNVSFLDTSNASYPLATAPLVPSSAIPGVSFVNSANPQVQPGAAQTVTVADFNGDGKPDVEVTGDGSIPVIVWLGNGDGTFAAAPNSPSLNLSEGFAVAADFNGDGKQDLVVDLPEESPPNGNLQIVLGNGDGTFTLGQLMSFANLQCIATGDFNGDGVADLAFAAPGVPANTSPGIVGVLLGKGDGTFTLKSTTQVGLYPVSIAVGDYNGDGKPDLAIANEFSNSVTVLLGNGDGTFTSVPETPATGVEPLTVVAADFNRDGILDLAVANAAQAYTPGSVTILLGNGDGKFTPTANAVTGSTTLGPGPTTPEAIAVGDFNADGKADLVVSDITNLWVVLGNGDGTFAPPLAQAVFSTKPSTSIFGIATGDFNVDGLSDIAAINQASSIVGVLLGYSGPQSATATADGVSVVGTGTHQVDASFPGDGEYQPSVSTTVGLTAQPVTTTLVLTANPVSSNYGRQVSLTATVAPSTPQQNHLPSGTVTFIDGSTVVGTATVSNGLATFNTTLLPTGTDKLTASYSGDTNFLPSTASAMETVIGSPSATTLTAVPNPAGAGQTVTLTAVVTGVGLSTTATGSVTFYDGASALGTVALGTTGQASFTTSTLALGTHTLTASYAGDATYVVSASAPVSETIIKSDFTIAIANPSITLATYQNTTTTITLNSLGAFADTVALTCGKLPTYLTCLPMPASALMTANGSATVSLYLDTNSIVGGYGKSGPLARSGLRSPATFGLLLLPACALGLRRRRCSTLLSLVLAFLALPLALELTACGGSVTTPVPAVAPGTYTITITATGASTGLSHTAQLTLTVTQ